MQTTEVKRTYERFVDEEGRLYVGYYIEQPSGVIYYIKTVDGVAYKFSCKTREIKKATKFAESEVKRRANKKKYASRLLIGKEMDNYIALRDQDHQSGEITKRTYQCVKASLEKARPFWKDLMPDDIDRDSWAEFCDWFQEKYKGEQMFNVTKYMRSLCKYLVEKRAMHAYPTLKDPTARKARRARQKKRARVLTDEEIKTILSVCDETEQLIVLLMFTMGMRVSEACGLQWESLDMDPDDPVFLFSEDNNKAGHVGSQSIHPEVYRRLLSLGPKDFGPVFPQKRKPDQPLRPQQIDWKGLRKRAGIKGLHWTPHSFRHACLTRLFSDPTNPQALIMKCYRVSLAVALEHYVHITPDGRKQMAGAVRVSI